MTRGTELAGGDEGSCCASRTVAASTDSKSPPARAITRHMTNLPKRKECSAN